MFIARKVLWSLPSVGSVLFICGFISLVRRKPLKLLNCLFVIYLVVLFSITLDLDRIWVCLWYNMPMSSVWTKGGLNLRLFNHLNSFADFLGVFENIIMFIPLGIFVPISLNKKSCCFCIITGIAISLIIETIQLFIGRVFDINDFITNVAGAFIGWIMWRTIFEYKSVD